MDGFVELSNDEINSIDGGSLAGKIGYAAGAYSAYELSGACLGAITVSAPAIATAGLITGGLAFGVVAVICLGGLLFG